MSNIGLCGAHRTGKTDLATALSFALDMPFIPLNTTDIFLRYHLNPSKPMDFKTRMDIQHRILDYAVDTWSNASQPFISDRTPIDMFAYTIAEVQGNTLNARMEAELADYKLRCQQATEKYFGNVVLVPPAIPIIDAIGKASPSRGYIEHIHLLCLGLLHSSHVMGYVIDEDVTNIEARAADVKRFYRVK